MPDPTADPPDPASRRRSRVRRTVLVVSGALVLVLVLLGIGGAVLLRSYDSAVNRDVLLAPSARVAHGSVHGPLNLLLIGSDQRVGNPDAGERSDTIIVAHVPRTMDHVFLISVPRDLLVTIPPMPSVNFGGDTTKINAAFEYGRGGVAGAQLVSATLTDLLDVRFDGAAVIDFSGLQGAVNVLGGVRMCVDERVVSIHTSKVFEPGCGVMQSADVLDYLRQRNFPDGDYSRQRHQQEFLKAVLEQARSSGTVSNPVKLDALIRAVAGTMTVDTGETALTDLVFALRDLTPDSVIGIKIPSYPDTINQVSYVIASPEANGLFQAIQTDKVEQWANSNQQWVNKI